MRSLVVSRSASTVYDYCWFPYMDSRHPSTCTFLSTCRDGPIHLLDAYSGVLRASYRGYSLSTDELTSALSLSFSVDAKRLYAGYDSCVRVFDVERPGRDCAALRTSSARKRMDGQKGILSVVQPAEALNVVAAGSYAGSIYLYDERDRAGCVGGIMPAAVGEDGGIDRGLVGGGGGVRLLEGMKVNSASSLGSKKRRRGEGAGPCALLDSEEADATNDAPFSAVADAARSRFYRNATSGGVTGLRWSPAGGTENSFLLYSASRRSDAVVAWDVRFLTCSVSGASARPVASYYRSGNTNQRLDFDLSPNGDTLFVGGLDGRVLIYDTGCGGAEGCAKGEIGGIGDAANGVSVIGEGGGGKGLAVAVAVGQRHYEIVGCSDDEDGGGGCGGEEEQQQTSSNSNKKKEKKKEKYVGDLLVFKGTL